MVHHSASGNIHLLDNESAALLLAIINKPSTYEELKSIISNSVESNEDNLEDNIQEYLNLVVKQFVELDLIESVRQ